MMVDLSWGSPQRYVIRFRDARVLDSLDKGGHLRHQQWPGIRLRLDFLRPSAMRRPSQGMF